jgi:hypothetical protein
MLSIFMTGLSIESMRTVKLTAPSFAPANAVMTMFRDVNMSLCPFQVGQMGSVPCSLDNQAAHTVSECRSQSATRTHIEPLLLRVLRLVQRVSPAEAGSCVAHVQPDA